jgi:O-antigen ligase
MRQFVIRWGQAALQGLALSAIIFSTAVFGAVHGWAFALTFGLLGAAFCLWAGLRILFGSQATECLDRSDSIPPLRIRSRWAPWWLLLLGLILVVQLIPLPAEMVAVLSPQRAALEQAFRQALGEPMPRVLTLASQPQAARDALIMIPASLMAFALGAYFAGHRARARRTMRIFLLLALSEAAYGLAEVFSGHRQILWRPMEAAWASGTFINRNHFAALLSLFFPASVGWCFYRMQPHGATPGEGEPEPAMSLRECLSSGDGLWLFAPALLMVGIIQSGSRSGCSSMILGGALFFALRSRRRMVRTASWLTALLGLILLAYALNSNLADVMGRFAALARRGEGRLTLWRDGLGMVRDYPLFGVGLGNFANLFKRYNTLRTTLYPYQAHNEWLEGLITLGVAGMLPLLLLVVQCFIMAYRRLSLARSDRPWLLGLWCGLIGLAAHSFTEFNFHIPSLAITSFFILGLLMGYDHPPRRAGCALEPTQASAGGKGAYS